MKIIRATKQYLKEWVNLRFKLWPKHVKLGLRKEALRILNNPKEPVFLVLNEHEKPVGFAEFTIRSYVDGCTSKPVGFLDGIYISPEYRRKGLAEKLVRIGERWAAGQGCKEFGSDTEIDNVKSIAFHKAIGFRITDRQVVFIKKITK